MGACSLSQVGQSDPVVLGRAPLVAVALPCKPQGGLEEICATSSRVPKGSRQYVHLKSLLCDVAMVELRGTQSGKPRCYHVLALKERKDMTHEHHSHLLL